MKQSLTVSIVQSIVPQEKSYLFSLLACCLLFSNLVFAESPENIRSHLEKTIWDSVSNTYIGAQQEKLEINLTIPSTVSLLSPCNEPWLIENKKGS